VTWGAFAASLAILCAAACGFILLIRWADASDARHEKKVARERLVACGSDRTIDMAAKEGGWWYEVKCRRPNGDVYVVVVK
jgi:hypothetical protein